MREEVTQINIRPVWEITQEAINAIVRNATGVLATMASRELAIPLGQLISRPLLHSDLDIAKWNTPSLQEGMQTTWVNTTIADKRFIGIYKIAQLSKEPTVSEIRFEIGCAHAVRGIFDLDILQSAKLILDTIEEKGDVFIRRFGSIDKIRMEAFLPMVFVCPQNTFFKVTVVSIKDNDAGDAVVLGGVVIEPMGLRIVP